MGEYIRGVVVKLHLTPEQEVLFKENYGCTRKTRNELLNKYKAKYGDDSTKIPTKKELNQFLNESKKELPYLNETESTSLQQARDDLHKAFTNCAKSKRHNPPKFHSKKKTRPSFRQTTRKDKRPVENNTLTLRKHGKVTFSTSVEYLDLLNSPQTKFNNITVYYDGLNHYAVFNIETNPPEQLPLTEKHIGCDINSNKNGWLVTSEKQKEFFDVDHDNQMIQHINRLMSKCRNKSRRWKKQEKRLQKWYNKRTNQLNDYIEKLTYQLVKEYDTIVFEKKLLYYQNLNRRRTKHDLSSIAIHTKTKRQIPTLQTRSRRRTIRKILQHKPNMPPLRTHKTRVRRKNKKIYLSKMRKGT